MWPIKSKGFWNGEFFPLQRNYAYRDGDTEMDLDGVADDGDNVRVTINGFRPRFYMNFLGVRDLDVGRARKVLDAVVEAITLHRNHYYLKNRTKGVIASTSVEKKTLIANNSVPPHDRYDLLRVETFHPQSVGLISNFLANPQGRDANSWDDEIPYWCSDDDLLLDVQSVQLYDSNVGFDVIFGAETGIDTCRWYSTTANMVPPTKWDRVGKCQVSMKRTRFAYEFASIDIRHLVRLDKEDDPPLKCLYFDIEAETDGREFPDAKKHPILQNCVYTFCTPGTGMKSQTWKPKASAWTLGSATSKLLDIDRTGFSDEKIMLENFSKFVSWCDPHIIAAHNGNGFDLPYMTDRSKQLGHTRFSSDMSLIEGKSVRHNELEVKGFTRHSFDIPGRIVLDTMIYRGNFYEAYDRSLDACAKEFLDKESKIVIPYEAIAAKQKSHAGRTSLLRYCLKDAELVQLLAEKWACHISMFSWGRMGVPPTKFLNKEATSKVECVLSKHISKRDGVYLDRKFRDRGEKFYDLGAPLTDKEIRGAITIPQVRGYHDAHWPIEMTRKCMYVKRRPVSILDFEGLYPSVCMQRNIGIDTLGHKEDFEKRALPYYQMCEYGEDPLPHAPCFLDVTVKKSVLSEMLFDARDTRRAKKQLLKAEIRKVDADAYAAQHGIPPGDLKGGGSKAMVTVYDNEQNNLKTLMNSSYGMHAFRDSRFYHAAVAAAIPWGGRYYLKMVEHLLKEKFDYSVVGGDTDSLFLEMAEGEEDCDAAMGECFEYVDPLLGEHVHFVPEKTWWRCVFPGLKKHYYALQVDYGQPMEKAKIIVKGCTFKKRKMCLFVKNACMRAVEIVLKEPPEERLELLTACFRDAARKLSKGEVRINELVEQQKMKRKLSEYAVKMPALAVAEREWRELCAKAVKDGTDVPPEPGAGKIVSWIVSNVIGGKTISERARSPEEYVVEKLAYDAKHYREVLKRQFATYFSIPYLALSGRNPYPDFLANLPQPEDAGDMDEAKKMKDKNKREDMKHYGKSFNEIVAKIPTQVVALRDPKAKGTMESFFSRKRKREDAGEGDAIKVTMSKCESDCRKCLDIEDADEAANDAKDCCSWKCPTRGEREYCEAKLSKIYSS